MKLGKTISANKYKQCLLLILLFTGTHCFPQFFNKEIVGDIKFEDKGEYLEFSATAENLTPSDYSLRYEFLLYKTDKNGNISRSNQENRFFLESYKKDILSSVTVNKSDEGTLTVVLLIFDQEDKPLGKDRIELKNSIEGIEEIKQDQDKPAPASQEEAKPQDGFSLNGLVVENTITKVGRDFFKYFYSEFYNKEIKTSSDIEIDEVPGRGRMTMLSVKVGNQVIMRFFGQPKKEYLQNMASVALQRAIAQLQKLEQQESNFKHY
ncbi:CsgE family curli-type amyloid fiber assembly protein [Christiangramia sp. LLG6405-1]|uniref:CsgE family curli-type amyloid fiber assembly protein n=1 Tax=Christiangramia sp. LLG6405-1 TaxID=3160832 RepID=UPI00386A6628